MAESEVELKSSLMKVEEESEKVGLKLNIQKTNIMASGPTTSWQIDGETVETVLDFLFFGKIISLLFNILSMLVMAFFPKEQASFNFMTAVTIYCDFGDQENKVNHCFLLFPQSIYHEMMGLDVMILVF